MSFMNANGVECGISVKEGQLNKSYINPDALASLIGAVGSLGYSGVELGFGCKVMKKGADGVPISSKMIQLSSKHLEITHFWMILLWSLDDCFICFGRK